MDYIPACILKSLIFRSPARFIRVPEVTIHFHNESASTRSRNEEVDFATDDKFMVTESDFHFLQHGADPSLHIGNGLASNPGCPAHDPTDLAWRVSIFLGENQFTHRPSCTGGFPSDEARARMLAPSQIRTCEAGIKSPFTGNRQAGRPDPASSSFTSY